MEKANEKKTEMNAESLTTAPPLHSLPKATTVATSPQVKDLTPGVRETHLLDALWQWHGNSLKSPIILGQPLPER